MKHLYLIAALCAASPALAQPLGAGGDDYPVNRVIAPYPGSAPYYPPPLHQQPVDEELERARRHNQLLSQEFQRRILEQALERMERAAR